MNLGNYQRATTFPGLNVVAGGGAEITDRYVIGGLADGETIPVTLLMHVTGNMTYGGGLGQQQAGIFALTAASGTPSQTQLAITAPDSQGHVAVTTDGGYGTFHNQIGSLLPSDIDLVLSTQVNVSASQPVLSYIASMGLTPEPSLTTDFSHTASLALVLPSGLTVTSDSSLVMPRRDPSDLVPRANAGPDQTVSELSPVTLDGSGSSSLLGLPLQWTWTQVSGLPVVLNLSDPVHPTFLAPEVPVAGSTLTFQLVVSDGQLSSTPTTVNITVKNINHPPIAVVGLDQNVAEASLVTLDGSASFDPDAEPLTYVWQQLSGPTVTLSDPTQAKPTFLAPLVGSTGVTLSFQLTVSDGQATGSIATNVNVTNINHPPVANAGLDQTRIGSAQLHLDGTASSDPDSDPLTFTWSQLSGPTMVLSDIHSATPSFTAPQVSSLTTLTFHLLVDDGLGGTAGDDVTITLVPVDAPPVCTQAHAHPQSLWPPDYKLERVAIRGVTDPDDKRVTLTVTGVTQDEPVSCAPNVGTCRQTAPDAVIHKNGHVSLRAERTSTNGRVYQVTFVADDGAGGTCTGHVKVCVPGTRGATCVDDGQHYDSTQP